MKLKSVKFNEHYNRSLFYFTHSSESKIQASTTITRPILFIKNIRNIIRANVFSWYMSL